MTSSTTYGFTAFTEADLLDAGAAGHGLSCGDIFTMPAAATICFEVADNDSFLSGDTKKNENANDKYGQTATITDAGTGVEIGNGGQIYAEKFWTLQGSDGKIYYLIEIEQEGGDAPGTGDDYFTFYGDVPSKEVALTVTSGGNVKGNWVDFKCLDAGVKLEPDADGSICIEAEHLELSGYRIEHQDAASGDELIKLSCNTGYAKLPSFNGESCVYDISITVIDENDGEGFLDVFVDGEFVGCFQLNQNNNGNGVHDVSFSTLTLSGVEIPEGAEITFKGRSDGYEFIRIDKIAFDKVEFRVCDDPDAVNLGFDGFMAGDILTDLEGLTISATGGSGDAMVFDSENPTGGDFDLETQVTMQGNILIVSEDGDSSDPDDAIDGAITIDFDNPAEVLDLKVIDTEEGGLITATLRNGDAVEIEIPQIANGGVAQVLIDLQDVVSLEIMITGSGGIDDLCYIPTGSLSGRYFFDANCDGLDNDGDAGGEGPGVEGILVELLDANGQPTGKSTMTEADGAYSFTGLAPGTYGVSFAAPPPKQEFTIANVGDNAFEDIDSDAIVTDAGTAVISAIVVRPDQNAPDNDVGVGPSNEAPEAEDVAAAVCADEAGHINLINAVTDPDGDTDVVSIISINDGDETAGVGESITLDSAGVVTLNADGTVSFDPNDAYDDLLIRESVLDQFQFTAADKKGATATATADIKICGALNTIETIAEGFVDTTGDPLQASYRVDVEFDFDFDVSPPVITIDFPVTVTASAPPDPRLEDILGPDGEATFDDAFAYCVDKNGLLEYGVDVPSNLHIIGGDAINTANSFIAAAVDQEQNLDIITWILNQDFQSLDAGTLDDGDLGTSGSTGETYDFFEVQEAIWFFTDGALVDPSTEPGANSQDIIDLAMVEGEGFVAGEGDIVAVLFDPIEEDRQTYMVGVEFETLKEDCDCVL